LNFNELQRSYKMDKNDFNEFQDLS
jgi:hypothetical protein